MEIESFLLLSYYFYAICAGMETESFLVDFCHWLL